MLEEGPGGCALKPAALRRALQADLEHALCRLAELDRPTVDRGGDEHDVILDAEANEATTRRRSDLRAKAKRIELALERIDDGSYGRCTHCGAEIAPRRLQVMPEATTCLPCKEADERAEERPGQLRRVPRIGVPADEEPA